jgi:hypothetical protein
VGLPNFIFQPRNYSGSNLGALITVSAVEDQFFETFELKVVTVQSPRQTRIPQLKPDFRTAWYNLGAIQAEQGNHTEAMQVYEKLKTLDEAMAQEFLRKCVAP